MALSSLDVYDSGLDFFSGIVRAVPDDAWDRPAPCEGWTALDVLGHLCEIAGMGSAILREEQIDFSPHEPPSTAVEGDPVECWNGLAAEAHETLKNVGDLDREIDSPMGRRTIRDGLSFPAADLYLHGWDLGVATGQAVTIPDDVVGFIRGMFTHIPDEATRQPGIFGPAHPEPDGASATESLIAWTGRDPRWSA